MPMINGRKCVEFSDLLETVTFGNMLKDKTPTQEFMKKVEEQNKRQNEQVNFASSKTSEPGQSFDEVWQAEIQSYNLYVRPADLEIFNSFLGFRDMTEEELFFERIDDLKNCRFFEMFMDMYMMVDRISTYNIVSGYTKLAREGKWEAMKQILRAYETEWKKHAEYKFDMQTDEIEEFKEAYGTGMNSLLKRLIKDGRTQVFRSPKFADNEEDNLQKRNAALEGFDSRWAEYRDFILDPIFVYNTWKRRFVRSYFKLFDKGIIVTMINNTYDKTVSPPKSIVSHLVEWPTPDSLKLEGALRVLFPPLVNADREFSCNHDLLNPSEVPEFETLEEAKQVDSKTIEAISCRQHPGRLLLLLIRLDLKDMVKFAVDNGMPVNCTSNSGHCKSLRWSTDTLKTSRESRCEMEQATNGVSQMEIARAGESAEKFFTTLNDNVEKDREILDAEFSLVTPLAVAVENAVYGTDLDIVEMLINSDANPLLCSDVAVKACVNALSLMSGEQKRMTIPMLAVAEKPEAESKTEQAIESGSKKNVPPKAVSIRKRRTLSTPRRKSMDKSWIHSNSKKSSNNSRKNAQLELAGVRRVSRNAKLFQQNSEETPDTKERVRTNSTGRPRSKRFDERKKVFNEATRRRSKEDKLEISRALENTWKKGKVQSETAVSLAKKGIGAKSPVARLQSEGSIDKSTKRRQLSILSPGKPEDQLNERIKIARGRAEQCLQIISCLVLQDYSYVKENHCTRMLLYQACIQKRDGAVWHLVERRRDFTTERRRSKLSMKSTLSTLASDGSLSSVDGKIPDMEAFELLVSVVDCLLNDGLQHTYPTYSTVLYPIYKFMKRYQMYLNNWRFIQLISLLKLAMEENIAGDRQCLIDFMKLPQVMHFLGVKKDEAWEIKKLENLALSDPLRVKLRIESQVQRVKKTKPAPYNFAEIDADVSAKQALEFEKRKQEQLDMKTIEKLLVLATKMECLEIIDIFVSCHIKPSPKKRFKMIAMAVKYQNTGLFEYLYNNFGHESILNNSFVIALKGKYHQSLKKVFDLGFKIKLFKTQRVRSENSASTGGGSKKRKAKSAERRNRELLNLFSMCLDDVLFERTIFDHDDGRRSKEGFTRQDEETTFSLLVQFLVENLDDLYLKRVLSKLVKRSSDEYENRIWFFGFHEILCLLVKHKKFSVIDSEFIETYGLNYTQWQLYTMDLKKKYEDRRISKRMEKLRRRKRNWNRKGSRNRGSKKRDSNYSADSNSSSETAEEPKDIKTLDTEAFLNKATAHVENSLEKILEHKSVSEEVQNLSDKIDQVSELVKDAYRELARAQRTLVEPQCRRNGSRNYDYLFMHSMENGASEML